MRGGIRPPHAWPHGGGAWGRLDLSHIQGRQGGESSDQLFPIQYTELGVEEMWGIVEDDLTEDCPKQELSKELPSWSYISKQELPKEEVACCAITRLATRGQHQGLVTWDTFVREKVFDRRSKLTKFILLGKKFQLKVLANYRHFLRVS